MLFLMNDHVLQLDPKGATLAAKSVEGQRLTFISTLNLGQEMFAKDPDLHRKNPQHAHLLANLLVAKQPSVNAALFFAPTHNCQPKDVIVRYCQVDYFLLGQLLNLEKAHGHGNWANQEVWNKLSQKS